MSKFTEQLKNVIEDRGNLSGKLSDDLYFWWSHVNRVDIKEYKDGKVDEDNIIRVMSITGTGCKIQFRMCSPLTRGGKPKNILTEGFISKRELERILAEMNKKAY